MTPHFSASWIGKQRSICDENARIQREIASYLAESTLNMRGKLRGQTRALHHARTASLPNVLPVRAPRFGESRAASSVDFAYQLAR